MLACVGFGFISPGLPNQPDLINVDLPDLID